MVTLVLTRVMREEIALDDVTSERSSNFGASPSLTAMDDERMDGDDRWKSRHALVEQKMNRMREIGSPTARSGQSSPTGNNRSSPTNINSEISQLSLPPSAAPLLKAGKGKSDDNRDPE